MANRNQGDVVFLKPDKFNPNIPNLKDGHPVLIISCESCNARDNYYTGVMLSHTAISDRHSFMLKPDMFEAKMNSDSAQARLHITISFHESDVSTFVNRLKRIHLTNLLKKFIMSTLGI